MYMDFCFFFQSIMSQLTFITNMLAQIHDLYELDHEGIVRQLVIFSSHIYWVLPQYK